MARNSEAAKARKRANLAHYSEALQGFVEQYDINLEVFGGGIHWRLENAHVTLDCWPTTGRYWIKQADIGIGLNGRMHEKGFLPHDYMQLDKFLSDLFLKKK